MASIYDSIPAWSAIAENKFDIASYQNRFFYAIRDMTAGQNGTVPTSSLQTNWDGYILLNGNLLPNFWWKPSYNSRVENKPRIRYNQFGNGYQQRIPDGLNTSLVEFNIGFENRSELETVSILHFLQQRNGQESFIYNIPTIFSKSLNNLNTRFICPDWTSSYVSYNNYNIECKFVEVPV
jgi:phage-related protein